MYPEFDRYGIYINQYNAKIMKKMRKTSVRSDIERLEVGESVLIHKDRMRVSSVRSTAHIISSDLSRSYTVNKLKNTVRVTRNS